MRCSGGGHVALHGQVGEKGLDPSTGSGQRLGRAHVLGVTLVVKKDVAFDPVDVGLFGADGVVLEADDVAHLIKQFLGTMCHLRRLFGICA